MAQNPENAKAQKIVNQLKAQGMSNAEIARRVGRDSSLISQISRKGNKGASLVGALQQVQRGATKVSVQRRTTKAGTQAKTRRGVKSIPGTDNITVDTKKGNKTIINGLGAVSGKGKYVKWRIAVTWVQTISKKKYKNTGIDGHLPRGWTSDDLENRINNPQTGDSWQAGDALGALKAIAMSQNQGAYTSVGATKGVHLYTVD